MISADLGSRLESFIQQLVAAGRYHSKSEVLREGGASHPGARDQARSAGCSRCAGPRRRRGRSHETREGGIHTAAGQVPRGGREAGFKVSLTQHAGPDLDDIAAFIARDHPSRALTFVDELYEKCVSLADTPTAFPLIPRYEALDLRRRVHGDHLILFTVKRKTTTVLRVLHGARDFLPLVLGDPWA